MHLLLAHAWFLADDAAERAVMKPYPPLGLLYLAAWLRPRGVSVGVFDSTFSTRAAFADVLDRERPSVVGLYVTLMTRRPALDLMRAARARGCRVVVGGPEPINHAAEYLARGADVVVAGEGEITLERVLGALAAADPGRALADVPGIAFLGADGAIVRTGAGPLVPDLDSLPFPDRSAIDLDAYVGVWRARHGMGSVSVITARGCPYRCNWCSHSVYGFTHRRRSPGNVADEVEQVLDRYRPDMLWYADDVFTISHRWLSAYASELGRRGLRVPFETISREDRLNEEVIRTLAAMGCFRLWIGAESGSQRVLDAMERGTDAARTREMVRLLQRHGIEAGSFIMLGYDGEEVTDIEATVAHLKAAPPDRVLATVAYPIAGTGYHERVAGRVVPLAPWHEGSDRQTTVAGRRSRRFYRVATRWVMSEWALARQRRSPDRSYPRLLRSYASARLGRLGMKLTARSVEGS
jgi:radical SAM superfamily enzyme YgiQ (UPF0313 family)